METLALVILVFLLLFTVYLWGVFHRAERETLHNFGEPCGKYDHCHEDDYCTERICLSKYDIPNLKVLDKVLLTTPEGLYLSAKDEKVTLEKEVPSFRWNYNPLSKILSTDDGRFLSLSDNKLVLGSSSSPLFLSKKEETFYMKDEKGNYLFIDCSRLPWSIEITLPHLAIKPLVLRVK